MLMFGNCFIIRARLKVHSGSQRLGIETPAPKLEKKMRKKRLFR
jgi:hypothetical protein